MMRRAAFTVLVASFALTAGACGGGDAPGDTERVPAESGVSPAPAASVTVWTPTQLGTLAAEIRLNPAAAESLLAARGLDAAELDSLVFAIAEDAAATAEDLAALNR
jgi:hypothetical protein